MRSDANGDAVNSNKMTNGNKKKPKPYEVLSTFLFLGVIYLFAILMILIPDREYSTDENRSLAQFPTLSSESSGSIFERVSDGKFLDRLISGKFNSDMVSYFSDQFPFRNVFVGIKALSECVMLGRENNGFFAAADGYIIERCDSVDVSVLNEYRCVIEEFAEAMSERNIPVTVAVIGRVSDVMEDELPLVYRRGKVYENTLKKIEECIFSEGDCTPAFEYVNLCDALNNYKETEKQLYYRTDHHWTTYGAYAAYCSLANSLGFVPYEEDEFDIKSVSDTFYGTSWRSSGMKWRAPDEICFWRYDGDENFLSENLLSGETYQGFYREEYLSKTDKYSTFLGENSALLRVCESDTRKNDDKETLLLIKDSFSHSLVPFLARHYNLVLLDCRYYNLYGHDLISEYDVDKVLFIGYVDTYIERSSSLGTVSLIYNP